MGPDRKMMLIPPVLHGMLKEITKAAGHSPQQHFVVNTAMIGWSGRFSTGLCGGVSLRQAGRPCTSGSTTSLSFEHRMGNEAVSHRKLRAEDFSGTIGI